MSNETLENTLAVLQLVASNGGIASLDDKEALAIVNAIQDLHRAGTAVIGFYNHYCTIQQVGGQPLEQAMDNLSDTISRTGG